MPISTPVRNGTQAAPTRDAAPVVALALMCGNRRE
jgi:hypothetical protein